MRPFKFRLETLLKVRRLQEEEAQVRLGQATARLVAEQERMAACEAVLENHLNDFRRQLGEPVTIDTLKVLRNYSDKIKEDISAQRDRVSAAEAGHRQAITELEEAAKARKLVEKLRERQLADYQAEVLREEQNLLDELGLQAFSRGS